MQVGNFWSVYLYLSNYMTQFDYIFKNKKEMQILYMGWESIANTGLGRRKLLLYTNFFNVEIIVVYLQNFM